MDYMIYFKIIIDFIMKLVAFFKKSDNTEADPEQQEV